MNKYLKISKNKGIEFTLEFLNFDIEWFKFLVETRTKQDHLGIILRVELLKIINFEIHFYDSRHWDYENNKFCIYNKKEDYIIFNPDNKDINILSDAEIFDSAMEITEKENAIEYLNDYINFLKKLQVIDSEKVAKENLAYYAGYYSDEIRLRVETLFECEHPYFGSIEKNGSPTAKEAFEIGKKLGEKFKTKNNETNN